MISAESRSNSKDNADATRYGRPTQISNIMKKIRFNTIADATMKTIRMFPVESAIMLYVFVLTALNIGDVELPNDANLGLAPLFFMLAYILNTFFRLGSGSAEAGGAEMKRGLAWIYLLCWLPIVPLWLVDPKEWMLSLDYAVAAAVLAGGVLVCRKAADNTRFAFESLNYMFDAALALVFASVAYGLVMAIYGSVVSIFGLDWDVIPDFSAYSAAFTYCIACPLMFLSFVRGYIGRNPFPSRFFDILLNFILTPALLAYAVLLNLYFLKILIKWELPEGNVAIMVFCFTIIATLVKSCQPLLSKRYYDWFFDRFSLIAAPAVAMFWVGTVYRIGEYGLTTECVYLAVSGVVMTATLAMFACKGRGRYLHVVLMAMGLFALFTYIPPISAENMSLRNQKAIFERHAGALGMLDAQGRFKPEGERPDYDTLYSKEYVRAYSALRYLDNNARKADKPEERYGITPTDFHRLYPEASRPNDWEARYLWRPSGHIDVRGYDRMVEPAYHRPRNEGDYFTQTDNDILYIAISGSPAIQHQVADTLLTGEPAAPDTLAVEAVEQDDTVVELTEPSRIRLEDKILLKAAFDDIYRALVENAGGEPGASPDFDELDEDIDMFVYDADGIRVVFRSLTVKQDDGKYGLRDVQIEFILIKD